MRTNEEFSGSSAQTKGSRMNGKPIESFEHRLNILKKMAYKHASNRFMPYELMNEMWLRPQVRKAQSVPFLMIAARNAMWDYFRMQLGKRGEKKPHHVTLDPLLEDKIAEIAEIDAKMDFDSAISRLSRTQKLILKLRADFFTYREIGKIVGVSACRIQQLLHPIQRDLKLQRKLL